MSISFKNTCFSIWKTNTERKGIKTEFKPLFVRFIGVENQLEYNNILKTYLTKFEQNKHFCIYFDNEIPMEANFDLINNVKQELAQMNINDIEHQDIVLFSDLNMNNNFLKALSYVVNLAIRKENFFNESQRNNFIMKLIIWTFTYLTQLKQEIGKCSKCFYYGNISKHEIYFLIMLHKMGYDVIYVNPLKEEYWDNIDEEKLSELCKNNQILSIESLKQRASQGIEIQYTESTTLQFERELENELFTGTGVYRSWQFRDGTTKSLFVNSSLIDVNANWNEMAKVRHGFTTQGKTVSVPYFFHVVDGEYRDSNEYAEFVSKYSKMDNTLFIINDDPELSLNYNEEDKYKLTFCMLSNGLLDIEEIVKLDFYRYGKYKPEIQNFILSKINETISDIDLFTNKLSKDKILDVCMMLLHLHDKVIRLIDSFDYTEYIPKIVIFVENENQISEKTLYVIAYLSKIGFDIMLLNPSGLLNPNIVINKNRYNSDRLDVVKYDRTYNSLKFKDKKNFFNRLFG